MSDNFNKSRIAKNSILLYTRMLFTMWLNLYTTRLVLANLGVEDMGVYGVVGSIVSLFSVFSSGITNTIQRFITFELGKGSGDVNKIFCSSLNIIFLLAAFILLLLESVGLWFLYHEVNIPVSSMRAAFWVYQLSVVACIVNLISIPYNAIVIAHEKMDFYAVISILQVVLTCISSYCLSFIRSQRLLVYAFLIAAISILIRIFYQVYCYIIFKESRYRMFMDKETLKQIGRFAGVTTCSGILESVYNESVILIVNWVFGVALNAVYAIALQLKNSVLSFAFNIFKAMSPQITKTYASGEIEIHKRLVYSASKIQVYMIYLIMIPFLFRTEYIMHLWLGDVPPYMVVYAQATIILALLYALFEPIRTAVLATNDIAKFMIVPNVFYILSLPICYLFSLWSSNPVVLIISVVFIDLFGCGIRVFYALNVSPILFKDLIIKVIAPLVYVAIGSTLVCWLFSVLLQNSIMGLLVLLILNSVVLCGMIYFIGINSEERGLINSLIRKKISR